MEKFEFEDERGIEVFSSFVIKTKTVFNTLIDNIKSNIKDYEQKIEDTTKDISDNEASREKCEREITKMENQIDSIKETIENVENTYKKIADAYSSTSKGETKELYSDIINEAKANCEKDVEKNRSEIARLNSDIEAIKNNITEFTKIIDELNRDLEAYNLELFKYNKALEYLEKLFDKSNNDLDEISNRKEITKKPDIRTVKRPESKKTSRVREEIEEPKPKEKKSSPIETLESETFETPKETAPKRDVYEDSLKQIFDLTGYNPDKKEEPSVPSEPKKEVEEKKVYTDNLENLFGAPTLDTKSLVGEPETSTPFLDTDFTNWENYLNTPAEEKPQQSENDTTVNQVLVPYGTSFAKLKSLVVDSITKKDGSKIPFEIKVEDVMQAISNIDGNDLKAMKTVGPEITILRKIKKMKEGNR